jgi:hypothetical protein
MRMAAAWWRLAAAAALWLPTIACGQKGPPLAPLHLVPSPVTEVSARRVSDRTELRFVLPTRNANGPGRLDLDHVEIYAMTVPHGVVPPNRDFLTKTNLVGQVEVRPAPIEGEAPVEGDKRPGPGEAIRFEDVLTAEKLTPITPKPVAPPKSATPPKPLTPPPPPSPKTGQEPDAGLLDELPGATSLIADAQTAKSAAAASVGEPARIYVIRGVTKSGRPGPPSERVQIPVLPVPPPPGAVVARVTETAVVVEWKPNEKAPAASFNVYHSSDPMKPLNLSPLKEPKFEHAGVALGAEQCYRVRSVGVVSGVALEGDLSDESCVTPTDVFPPAAPKGLAAVPTPGQISLIWDANSEKDLAGYLVLRGEAPDGPLKAITPAPIKETSYRDTTVKSGVRYIYAIVAIDTATPPNTSAQSLRVEETAQ